MKDWAAMAHTGKKSYSETWENAPMVWRARLCSEIDAAATIISGLQEDSNAQAVSDAYRKHRFGIERFEQGSFSIDDVVALSETAASGEGDFVAEEKHESSVEKDGLAKSLKEVSFACQGLLPRDGEEAKRSVAEAAVDLLRAYDCMEMEQRLAAAELVRRAEESSAFGATQATEVRLAYSDSLELYSMLAEVQTKTDEAIQGYLDAALEETVQSSGGSPWISSSTFSLGEAQQDLDYYNPAFPSLMEPKDSPFSFPVMPAVEPPLGEQEDRTRSAETMDAILSTLRATAAITFTPAN